MIRGSRIGRARVEHGSRIADVTAAPAVPWTPAALPLIGWYDFHDSPRYTDDGVTLVSADAQAIYRCDDLSGAGNHIRQASAGSRPLHKTGILGGKDVARFDATTPQALVSAAFTGGALSTYTAPVTIIVVGNTTITGDYSFFCDGIDAGFWILHHWAGTFQMYAGNTLDGPASDTSNHVFAAIFNQASSKLYVDGGAGTAGYTGVAGLAGITVGSSRTLANALGGDIAALLVCYGALSAADLNLFGTYANARWAQSWATAS